MKTMVTARQKVLNYFTKTRNASAREISRSLKMSPATVRHHLRMLTADGRLELSIARSQGGRGRPEKVYSLPRSTLGDNLAALGDAILSEAGTAIQMEALAKRLAGQKNFADQPIAKRLNFTVEKLNGMKYHARWEAGPHGPRLIFGHCPYAALIGKHPELCQMDAALLEEWMRDAITQQLKIGKEGSSLCVFAVGG